jgi:hypothetical protein
MLLDKIFRDRHGEIIIAQTPNPPLILWIIATLLKSVVTSTKVSGGLDFLAFGALFTWAWLEIFDGVNYFRRALGLLVLASIMFSKIAGIS